MNKYEKYAIVWFTFVICLVVSINDLFSDIQTATAVIAIIVNSLLLGASLSSKEKV
jgi:hypothetical protein